MREAEEFMPLDGSGVAGMLREVFAADVTVARVACGGCPSVSEVGEVRVYGGAMGAVFRCAICDTAMMRFVETPAGIVLDLRGMRRLEMRAFS